MADFKIERGMIIRALVDQPPIKAGDVYRVVDVGSNLMLDGLDIRLPLDNTAWEQAYLVAAQEAEVIALPAPVVASTDASAPAATPTLLGKVLNFFKKSDSNDV